MSKNNTGINNSGDCNSGYYNSGDRNSGGYNSGDRNSGYYNSGHYNSGDFNSGYCNSGDCNSGHRNSGDCNSGHRNSGDCNSGHRNSGIFNTDEPNMRAFNKETDIKLSDFLESNDYVLVDLPLTRWVDKKDMTDEEKEEIEGWETTGGYLKTLEYKEAWAVWWKETTQEKRDKIQKYPNFDANIFKEITGIDIDTKLSETIKIGDLEFDKEEVEKRLEGLKPVK